MSRTLSGPERAAVLLINLGEEIAAKVLANLDDREIQNIGNYMSALGDVDMSVMDGINKEFYEMVESGTGGLGIAGMDFLKTALMQALDPAKATEILNNITTPGEEMGGGLETVRLLDPKIISSFIVNEHPQTAAIILAHLDPPVASLTIRELPEEHRMEIIHRLATLERVAPSVIRELDEALQSEFRTSGAVSGNKLGGVEVAAEVMGSLDRTTETSILTSMDEVDPDLANEIRNLRFTFEDILKIDDNGIQMIMKEINQEDLLIGLKTATDELKEKLFTNMSERAALMMKEDLESLGPTKISEVEKAQQKVIAVCKKLEEDGKLVIGGGADTLV
ncbi:MAG: flagellar motor switch protein FliG [Nitrospina sp.]|jgi:flagellar motor switch protein FliG|nr:flagellar motor switch protein FliG [Nitrospina sp.]MBT3874478.1 flagellar motor switch protein FliG [Nitrospina sp.]MBT4049110.1 flagellar motor switch protein FliG [Nitrospina sp.]MBT4559148.1 flagellar motor switch protein FliG [Nitrospina sp.]MBT5347814.1 flagellar motor switch protein FliG [Nitrospina sp.]